ncbi:acetyl-CoA acetyltransferase [Spirillospora sp. CA-108201]
MAHAGIDPRTPVLIGGGQISDREAGVEPVELMVRATLRAAGEAGGRNVLAAIDSVHVVGLLSWRYRNAGALLAERLGASPRRTGSTGSGGSNPQTLMNAAAESITAGASDVVLVTGAESWRTRMKMRAQGERPDWTRQEDSVPESELLIPDVPMDSESTSRAGLDRPAYVYPLFEQAIRAAAGRSHDEQMRISGGLWSRFSEVAATNPHAWNRRSYTADEITTPSADNRQVTWPYTKLMNSNNNVDQGAAVLMTSVEAAERLGVPQGNWVFLHAGTEARDTDDLGERQDLHRSPAIRAAGGELFRLTGTEADAVDHIDLYSCFPSAVQIAASELGLPLEDTTRMLTVTGGLTFAGGPWNNYSTHAIASLATQLRRDPGSHGLLTANSGYLTKHALGLYSTEPPTAGFRRVNVQAAVDAMPRRRSLAKYVGPARVDSWTAVYDRSGSPETGLVALLTTDGARVFARTTAKDALRRLVQEDCHGRKVFVDADATFKFDD